MRYGYYHVWLNVLRILPTQERGKRLADDPESDIAEILSDEMDGVENVRVLEPSQCPNYSYDSRNTSRKTTANDRKNEPGQY